MYEVEVKVPTDLERVRSRLEDGLEDGAFDVAPQGTVVQTDTYYDAPHRSFPETDEALRIRRETRPDDDSREETRVTYKGPLVDDESKTREEVETAVADGETFDAILTNLGFEPAATVRKERERFAVVIDAAGASLNEFTITLDAVDDVGEYVEVETEVAAEADLEPAREGAYAVLETLGLDPDEQLRTSYLGLLLESEDGSS